MQQLPVQKVVLWPELETKRQQLASACNIMIGQMQPSHQIAIEYSLNFRLIYHIALCKVLSPGFPIFQ